MGRVLTHWAREEDAGLAHGKLDAELERMERIVAVIRPGDLLLCNESFASTDEAEGSRIAQEVTTALVRSGVQVRSVTHLYDFARAVADDSALGAVFLRAPRAPSGERSFRLEPGPPLPTSFGLDLYDRAFGTHYADAEERARRRGRRDPLDGAGRPPGRRRHRRRHDRRGCDHAGTMTVWHTTAPGVEALESRCRHPG